MNKKPIDILFSLLRYELCGAEPSEEIKHFSDPEMTAALYDISKKHDMAHLIADALEKLNLYTEDSEARAAFHKKMVVAVYRYQQQVYEYEVVCRALEQECIQFVPLKGSVIREYYPEPWMRTSCDIDILVHEEDLERAVQALTEKYGYTLKGKCAHDISLISKSNVLLELHYTLMEDCYAKNSSEVLSSVWEYARQKNADGYCFCLSPEMFYFYHISHMVKHFEEGGCGVRPFIDLYFIEKAFPESFASCRDLLEKGGLLTFAKAARSLSESWMTGCSANKLDILMQQYIFSGGVYGNIHNRVLIRNGERGGKLKFVISRVFMPYNELKTIYPILNKHRILMPFFQAVRWFEIIFSDRLKKSLHELELNSSMTDSEENRTQQLLRYLGL